MRALAGEHVTRRNHCASLTLVCSRVLGCRRWCSRSSCGAAVQVREAAAEAAAAGRHGVVLDTCRLQNIRRSMWQQLEGVHRLRAAASATLADAGFAQDHAEKGGRTTAEWKGM